MGTDKSLSILFLEDNEDDVEIMVRSLIKAGLVFDGTFVSTLEAFKEKLLKLKPSIIISDYNLPSATALDALFEVKKLDLKIPFIVVSAFLGDERTVETLKAGVTDIVSKSRIEHLPFVIIRALEETKIRKAKDEAERELKISKERLELAVYGGDLGTWDLDKINNEIVYNPSARRILQIEDFPGVIPFSYFLPREKENSRHFRQIQKALDEYIQSANNIFEYELSFKSFDDSTIWVAITGKVITRGNNDEPTRLSGTVKDITQKKRNEDELIRNKTILEEAEKMGVIGSFEWDVENDEFYSSNGFKNILDYQDGELDHVDYFSNIHPSDRRIFEDVLKRKNEYYSVEHRILMTDGSIKPIRSSGRIICDSQNRISKIAGLIQDISEQRALKTAIFKGQDKERQRIAREIHDGIGQMLVAAKYRLMSMDEDSFSPSLVKDTEDLIDLILEESRRITKNLTAKIVEEHGLNKAVTFLVEDIKIATRLEFELVQTNLGILSQELSSSIYRIVQEALNNIVKYADATKVTLSLTSENEFLKIKITDNGRGFSTSNKKELVGNGLRNMQERALLFNGILEVQSEIGKGTTINCIVPIIDKT
jgi:signal transduction histidine kinase/FixJ family two-component response regulator